MIVLCLFLFFARRAFRVEDKSTLKEYVEKSIHVLRKVSLLRWRDFEKWYSLRAATCGILRAARCWTREHVAASRAAIPRNEGFAMYRDSGRPDRCAAGRQGAARSREERWFWLPKRGGTGATAPAYCARRYTYIVSNFFPNFWLSFHKL